MWVGLGAAMLGGAVAQGTGAVVELPSSKQLGAVPGSPQRVNSEPISMAVSPDGRYVVTVNVGYGTFESKYEQSLAVMDTQTGKVTDFPDARTGVDSKETLYSGLAFSPSGHYLYASMASLTAPEGDKATGNREQGTGNREQGTAKTGNGIAVYGFDAGKITPERLIPIGLQKLEGARKTKLIGGADGAMGVPYPAAIAVIPPIHGDETAMNGAPGLVAGERLLVADNLSDDALMIDAMTGKVLTRFDLSESDAVPSTYPVALAVSKDGTRGFVALWNASEVVELDLKAGLLGRKLELLKPGDPVKPGSHPCAMAVSPDGKTLYVTLANRDAVAAVDISGGMVPNIGMEHSGPAWVPSGKGSPKFEVKGYYDTRLPGQSYFGAEPVALALSADGSRLYAANMGSDAVAVIDTKKLMEKAAKQGMVEPVGFVPTEWMPMSLAILPTHGGKTAMNGAPGSVTGEHLYIATDKGRGTGPNDFAQKQATGGVSRHGDFSYIATLLYGSLAAVDVSKVDMKAATAEVMTANRMKAAEERIEFAESIKATAGPSTTPSLRSGAAQDDKQKKKEADSSAPSPQRASSPGTLNSLRNDNQAWAGPIKHVIYIIKENRTYDQIFGDLKATNGRPVGNGDAGLAMYGESVTPNQHKLALQFGVLDNFFDSGEVSGDGHEWSNAAISTDYNEKTWQQQYRNGQRTYDYEGVVANGYPLLQKIADVNEPASGFMWGNAEAHGRTHYNFGEYISSTFCGAKKSGSSQEGPVLEGPNCAKSAIVPGETIPAEWGGGVSKWPWAIPLLAGNVATKPELVGHFAAECPDFNLRVPDQIRAEVFLRHLAGWVADRATGKDTMPNYITVRMGDDHTAGTVVGGPTPKASVADNDLAVGRVVDAVSHSAYWDDTAIFILEDDAQNGADHVDAHRSLALVVSKYAPRAADGGTFVDSRFYTTVSVVRTMETLLGLPPMNNNDALAPLLGSMFTGPGDQLPFAADTANRENGLIYTANTANAVGAKESAKMDFTHADRADPSKLNVILWRDAMGDAAVPTQLTEKQRKAKKDADDD
jgi:DNA-binding beta-propeller fold protein YncE